jgi:nucleoside-diphosphate-sugar epimerase
MSEPKSERVAITGASGFIGGALIDHYRRSGVEVVGLDLRASPERGIVAADVSVRGSWERHLGGADCVIHTAAAVSNAVGDERAWRINALGTRNLIGAAVSQGVRRLVHISTCGVYGFHTPQAVSETYPVHCCGNVYRDTKIAAEHAVVAAGAQGELEIVVIRPADVYGPRCRVWITLPLQYLEKGLFLLPGNGNNAFFPIYIDDLVDGIVLAAHHEDGAGQIFNLAPSHPATTREFFSHHCRWLGKRGPICVPTPLALFLASVPYWVARTANRSTELGPATVRMLDRRGWLSSDKARARLGWSENVSLAEGMRCTEDWLRETGKLPSPAGRPRQRLRPRGAA